MEKTFQYSNAEEKPNKSLRKTSTDIRLPPPTLNEI